MLPIPNNNVSLILFRKVIALLQSLCGCSAIHFHSGVLSQCRILGGCVQFNDAKVSEKNLAAKSQIRRTYLLREEGNKLSKASSISHRYIHKYTYYSNMWPCNNLLGKETEAKNVGREVITKQKSINHIIRN